MENKKNNLNNTKEKTKKTKSATTTKNNTVKEITIKEKEDSLITKEGILEIFDDGYGFLRINNFETNKKDDIYVSDVLIKNYSLKIGDKIKGTCKQANKNSLNLQEILTINGVKYKENTTRSSFESLTPYYPTKKIILEHTGCSHTARFIDLFTPIGFGQRGMIVAQPKTGKTTLLKTIAQSIEKNYPKVSLFVLLIDERPEEVTDMQNSIKSPVIFSTFDSEPMHHIKVAKLVIEHAKRLVEIGKDVIILLDSLTRLTRAYNNVIEPSGRTLSGGLDSLAFFEPKKFFGAARNLCNNGSLTIIATALVNTGSRMDDVVYEEFKGTGNLEIVLDRELAEKRIFPAIDFNKSGTRKEELLLSSDELKATSRLRKIFNDKPDMIQVVLEMFAKSENNEILVKKLDAWLKLYCS